MINSKEKFTHSIPLRLRAARKARGFNNKFSFALACGIPLSTYAAQEDGNSEIKVTDIINYVNQLDVSPWWLLTGRGNPLGHLPKIIPNESACFRFHLRVEVEKSEGKKAPHSP